MDPAVDFAEIYAAHADEYDTLVRSEDAAGRLWRALDRLVGWTEANPVSTVCELGAGTGRLTVELVRRCRRVGAFDQSRAMLDVGRRRLAEHAGAKVAFGVAEHRAVPLADRSVDVVIEGWAFAHYIDFEPDRWRDSLDAALAECRRIVRDGGQIVLIETLGTGTTAATPPSGEHAALYAHLEDHHGFHRTEVRTDYGFADRAQAERLVGGFFGEPMLERLTGPDGTSLPEVTGIW
ncbi:MAG: class I SAM-dependent methyltransferase, partial [Ilumatobacteraceae bacterium]